MAKHTIQEELYGVLIFVAAVWIAFIVGWLLPVDFNAWGITPRSPKGLFGVLLAPFLHADWSHLISNTVPLVVLLLLLAGSRANSPLIVFLIILLSGMLLWIFGRSATHIGASGLIYGLIAFLVVSGLTEWRPIPLVIALIVTVLYGGTLLSGIVPQIDSHVSWEGHLLGAISGAVVAILTTRRRSNRSVAESVS